MNRRIFPIVATALFCSSLLFARAPSKSGQPMPPAATEDGISAYFSPQGGSEAAVIEQIDGATHTVDLQAYSFTSRGIGSALVHAAARGVKVRVVLDSKVAKEERREPDYLAAHGIDIWLDAQHPIAHNKVCLIDGAVLITGSFNFTEQAERSNAENLLVIHDHPKLVAAYEENFEEHLKHSYRYEPDEGKQ